MDKRELKVGTIYVARYHGMLIHVVLLSIHRREGWKNLYFSGRATTSLRGILSGKNTNETT